MIKLYNDPYKAIVGGKHPEALGQPASVVWSEIWDQIGPRLRNTVEENEGTYDESLQLMMERYGYPEETYYTFSYSPVPDEQGGVGGIICANTDDTERIIGERQIKLLRTLASETAEARTIAEACRQSAASLAHNAFDIPFALLYLLDVERHTLVLAGTCGIAREHQAAPATVDMDAEFPWPFAQILREPGMYRITDLEKRFSELPSGAWQRAAQQAVAIPIASSGQPGRAGILIVGLNPFRLFDESYQGFLDLVAGQIAASIANAQAYDEERRRAEVLAELDRAKTTFFSNVSHEFRTPLTLMLGPIEDMLAEEHLLSSEQRERTEILHRNALRLLRLVNTLLDFSRIEAGRMRAVYRPTDLALLTRDLASSFRSIVEKAGLAFIVDCPELAVPIYVDAEMWEKIVLNLVSNAFKYTLSGAITVRLQARESYVELSVQDTGVGIPEDELPHMFERFHRVKGAQGRTIEGTGIGLSLVQELVRMHGGTINVSSTPGKGSTFVVAIPVGKEHLPLNQIAEQQVHIATTVSPQVYVQEALGLLTGIEENESLPLEPSSLYRSAIVETQHPIARIVFADDNADMREYVSRLLGTRYAVQTVPDGRAALAAVKEYQPDLILSDVMMPEMDGFALLHALRVDVETRTLPIILLSARAGEEAESEGMEAGADDYLTKPFSARELLARVGAHLKIAQMRKQADALVRAERQRLYDLFQQVPANIVVFRGPEHVYELVNPLARKYIRKQGPITGQTVRQVQPELAGQGFFELLDQVYQSGQPFVGQEMLTYVDNNDDGSLQEVYFNFVYQPTRDMDGNVDGIILYGVDVTEQVHARQHSEALLRQQEDFLSVASHELKTPVTSLKAYAQLLERRFRRGGDERSADLLGKMDMQLTKLTGLVEDLLDVSKIENGQLALHSSRFEINALIAEVVEETQRTTPDHRIVQELAEPIILEADRDRIGQVITNLLTNAIKYSPQSQMVIVKTVCRERMLVISVQDFGIGISQEKLPHLFERFYRVEGESQLTYPGLGLGLYISAEFIKRHQGSMWVESMEGQGTTVSFTLPLLQAPDEQES